ncbi:basic helix-loop-helix protein [Trifolium repens]|nr:basic helix-loop-helix protein [Trifolium repens]
MAARAHDVAAMALRGRYACLNFADSVWRLPIPTTSNTKDSQKAATEAAEAFRPDKTLMNNDIDTVVAVVAAEELIVAVVAAEELNFQDDEDLKNMSVTIPRVVTAIGVAFVAAFHHNIKNCDCSTPERTYCQASSNPRKHSRTFAMVSVFEV